MTWPGRLYFGLFAFDAMHVLFINCVGYLLDALIDTLTASMKRELDRRASSFTPFRNPNDGLTTRRVRKLSSTAYLTAEMKVVHLFVWSHALGSRALLLHPSVRRDALLAITSLQIICFSVRGLRPFTREEHRYIFGTVGKRFFRALSNIHHFKRSKKIRDAQRYNIDKPPEKRRRVPHWRPAAKVPDESSDTVSSSDQDVAPYFLRSDKIIPHAFVHLAEQVYMGGSHKFHDTCAPESCHRRCLGMAGARARTYHDYNHSSDSMLNFMMDIRMLEEICEQSKICDDIGMYPPHIHKVHQRISPQYT